MNRRPPLALYLLVLCSGLAGLTWELLWQHFAGLATGVSAAGAALTLACTMGGLALGSTLMGRWLQARPQVKPLRAYAVLEGGIGLCGLLLPLGFHAIESVDAWAYGHTPGLTWAAQALAITLLLGPPALAMGATVPVFRRLADGWDTSVARLYAMNTAGAALGVLVAAFVVLPVAGVGDTGRLAALIDLAVAGVAWHLGRHAAAPPQPDEVSRGDAAVGLRLAAAVVLLTGFTTFALEVAWFRSLRSAFQSTTDSFALVLAAVLVSLALGARVAAALPDRRGALAGVLGAAGVLVLAATPIVERLDAFAPYSGGWWSVLGGRLALCAVVLGPPMIVLGAALPWVLDRLPDPRTVGRLYAFNTLGAVFGSLAAAWLLLPTIGFVPTSWAAGLLLGLAGLAVARSARGRLAIGAATAVALAAAVLTQSGVGRVRVQGAHLGGKHTVLASHEGPDATVSVIAHANGVRELVIDGFQTTGEEATGHYMAWMGHLPMLLHPDPKRALVICFGTGQTAHAVRSEGVEHLDIVDINDAVFRMAHHFESNRGVLADPRVAHHVMDGRAWLRRTEARYDVVTLEPMAPHFAGTNALYSRRFYELVRDRLNPGGVVAQWMPFHIITPDDAVAIAATFVAVFGDAGLWIDPIDRTGIIVGRVGEPSEAWSWPGLDRPFPRDLSPEAVRAGLRLGPRGMREYASLGQVITDDNQLLAYGKGRREMWRFGSNDRAHAANLLVVDRLAEYLRAHP